VRRCAPVTDPLRAALDGHRSRSGEEAADVARVLRLVASGRPWDRASALHVTASALIVHPPSRRVLLRWHERQQNWIQVGGHADPGEVDPRRVALREATEETGLTDLTLWPERTANFVHLVIVPVPAGKGEPAHEHADIRYVLATGTPEAIVPERASAPLRWLTLAGAARLTGEANVQESLRRIGELFDVRKT
jgi:8-oxo-dGTP pyrophosphatase MutT (NUDIX family)